MNEGSVKDYVDLQRLMFTLNAHFRGHTFQVFGDSKVGQAFRHNIRNGFETFLKFVGNSEEAVPRRAELRTALAQADQVTLIPIGSLTRTD
jgi:hypothetical protein